MIKSEIFSAIERELKKNADSQFATSRNRLIKSEPSSYGVKVSSIRRIAKDYLRACPSFLNSSDSLAVIEGLFSSGIFDMQMAGIFLAAPLGDSPGQFDWEDLGNTYRTWIECYINDWAVCDTFGTEILSPLLKDDNQSRQLLNSLSTSENRWARRISLVSLIKAKAKFKDWETTLNGLLPLYAGEKDYFEPVAYLPSGFGKLTP